MTRKLLVLFITLILCFYLLLSSFLGEKGFFYNKALKQEISNQSKVLEDLNNEWERLKAIQGNLETKRYLDDIAIKLGYKSSDDVVYYFNEKSPYPYNQINKNGEIKIEYKDVFYLKPFTIFIISFILSLIILLLKVLFVKSKKQKENDK